MSASISRGVNREALWIFHSQIIIHFPSIFPQFPFPSEANLDFSLNFSSLRDAKLFHNYCFWVLWNPIQWALNRDSETSKNCGETSSSQFSRPFTKAGRRRARQLFQWNMLVSKIVMNCDVLWTDSEGRGNWMKVIQFLCMEWKAPWWRVDSGSSGN